MLTLRAWSVGSGEVAGRLDSGHIAVEREVGRWLSRYERGGLLRTRRGGHIYTISPDGTGIIQVTSGPATGEVSDWRPA